MNPPPGGSVTVSWTKPPTVIAKCPFLIMLPTHWREDGTCRCDCAEHRKVMMQDWGYSEADFRSKGVIP
jgi:hypothetical protein